MGYLFEAQMAYLESQTNVLAWMEGPRAQAKGKHRALDCIMSSRR
jgi:hypothetical protein